MRDILPKTRAVYEMYHGAFRDWCRRRRIKQPAAHEHVGEYLDMLRESGAPRHHLATVLSSIARIYRESGQLLDTKHEAIQAALAAADALPTIDPVRWWETSDVDA